MLKVWPGPPDGLSKRAIEEWYMGEGWLTEEWIAEKKKRNQNLRTCETPNHLSLQKQE